MGYTFQAADRRAGQRAAPQTSATRTACARRSVVAGRRRSRGAISAQARVADANGCRRSGRMRSTLRQEKTRATTGMHTNENSPPPPPPPPRARTAHAAQSRALARTRNPHNTTQSCAHARAYSRTYTATDTMCSRALSLMAGTAATHHVRAPATRASNAVPAPNRHGQPHRRGRRR